ncbi:MAG: flagellar basal body P-ring formation protein FlgA [Tepidisphaera sp.]|nr:flagellar basal body P-ring formation protein FlgA [Tepidisphaera sp.]
MKASIRPERNFSPRRLGSLLVLGALVAFALLSARQAQGQDDVVSLKARVTVDASRPLTLGDVAEISGVEASKAAGVIVTPDKIYDGLRLDMPAIRRALELDKKINLGRVRLTGAACVVHIGAGQPAAGTAVSQSQVPEVVAPPGAETVRDRIGAHLANLFGIDSDDLRLTFDDSDAGILNRPTGGLTVGIQPQGSGDRLPLTVRMYDGERLVVSGSLRVGVEIRRRVLVASRSIARGEVVSEATATTDSQWLGASAAPADPEESMGQVVRAPVRAGEVINARDVEAPVVIRKGDLVAVDCICGGVVVRASLRAIEDGREGDVIQLRQLTGKTIIRARVTRAGEAVINAPSGLSEAGISLGGGR